MKKPNDFIKLVIANGINRFGDGVDTVAFTWLMYQVTGSAFWSAIYFACNQIPSIVLQPIAGSLIEFKDKRKIMAYADIIRGLVVIIMIIMTLYKSLNPILIIIFTIIMSSVEAFRLPAGMAIFPQLISKDKYDKAIGTNSAVSIFSNLIGVGISGILVSVLGYVFTMAIDAISFILSALFIFKISKKDRSMEIKNKERIPLKDSFIEGLRFVHSKPIIIHIIILASIINVALVPINALIVPYISSSLKLDAIGLSVFSVLLTLGMLLGSIMYSTVGDKIKDPIKFISTLGSVIGLQYIILNFIVSIKVTKFVALLTLSIIGFFLGLLMSLTMNKLTVIFLNSVEEEYLARVSALFNAVISSIAPIISLTIALLTKILTITQIFFIFGIVTIALMIIYQGYFILKGGELDVY